MRKIFNTTVYVKETGHGSVLRGIVQYDTLNEVNIRLSDGFKAFDYTGYTNIIFKVLKADGTTYIDSLGTRVVATSPADGIITVTLAGQATAAPGLCQSLIEVYSTGKKMATARLNYEVFESLEVNEEPIVSEPEYPVLQNLVAEISALESAIEIAESGRVQAEAGRVEAERIRQDLESGYVAQAKGYAEDAALSASKAAAVVAGDFATRAELEAVAKTATAAHAHKHAKGGSDAITPESIGAVPKRGGNAVYNNPCSVYAGAIAPEYVRIDLTDKAVAVWSMIEVDVSIRHTSAGGGFGKLMIGAVHGSLSEWGEAVVYQTGNLGAIEVFLSDRRYIYIKGLGGYAAVSVDRVLVGDAGTNYDMSAMSIAVVDSMPVVHQTATMKTMINEDNLSAHVERLTTEQIAAICK